MKCPNYVKKCIELLEGSGYLAYAVGGAVRDSLLCKEPSDWDVTTSARPDEILNVFSDFRTIPTGIKHGTVTVLFEDGDETRYGIEITTFRVDGEYRDARHPESVSFSSNIYDDLSRRDFTINAMAYNEKEGVIDAFGGRSDIKNRVIRTVGDPQKRFSEDALRILRAFRFSSQLEFEIEEETLKGASLCAHLLKNIARERIGAEFKKLVSCSGVLYSMQKMIENGIWQELFDIDEPTDKTLAELSRLNNNNFCTRLAFLLSGCDDGEKDAFLSSLRLSNNEKRHILRLCRVKEFKTPSSADKYSSSARLFLHLYGNVYDEAVEMLCAFSKEKQIEQFIKTLDLEKEKSNPLTLAELAIRGSDILPLCQGDHARVGLVLNALLQRVIEDPSINNKEILIEISKKELQ